MASSAHTGVVLLNLGTPEAPTLAAVKAYLKVFLMDPFVVDLSFFWRTVLVKGLILPLRLKKSTQAYQSIWTEKGSPLAVHHAQLVEAVEKKLFEKDPGGYVVLPVFRYGSLLLEAGLEKIAHEKTLSRLILVPLYPQYAYASTESSLQHASHVLRQPVWQALQPRAVKPFYEHPGFIQAIAAQLVAHAPQGFGDHVVLSFHGIPERHILKTVLPHAGCLKTPTCCDTLCFSNQNCYRAQCYRTAAKVAEVLQFTSRQYSVSFQSRLGRTPWIKPYTDHHLKQLAQQGIKNLVVCCPSFVADCLETLEEMGIRGKKDWQKAGGGAFTLIPCVNTHPVWVDAVVDMICDSAQQFPLV